MVQAKNAHKMLVRKLEGNRSLGRYRCTWEDNIKMYCSSNVWECSLDLTTSAEGQMTAICEQGDEFLGSMTD